DPVADGRCEVWSALLQYGWSLQMVLPGMRQRRGPLWLHGEHTRQRLNKAQFFELDKALPETIEIGARPGRHEDSRRRLPVELFADLEGGRFITVALIGLKGMDKGPARVRGEPVGKCVERTEVADWRGNARSVHAYLDILFDAHRASLRRLACRAKQEDKRRHARSGGQSGQGRANIPGGQAGQP